MSGPTKENTHTGATLPSPGDTLARVDVEGTQHRQRAAQAMALDRHAHLLAPHVVQLHRLAHLGQHLLPCRVPAQAAEPSIHLHVGVWARHSRLAQGGLVGHPLEAGDGTTPHHDDVPAAGKQMNP
jgi:hypothetical protein